MPETVRTAPPTDLAGLIPAQRAPEPDAGTTFVPATTDPAPERLAFLWAMLGAAAGAVVVGVAFLVLLTLLP